MKLVVHIDGGSRGNPGIAGVGVVVQTADDGTYLVRRGFFLGDHITNNVAEYTGLIRSIELAHALNPSAVRFVSDSLLVVNQVNGKWKVKDAKLKPLAKQTRAQLTGLPRWELTHVKRELNVTADELANLAMDARADIDLDDE